MAKIAFCILATDTTDRRTDEQMDRCVAWSRSRYRERRLNNTVHAFLANFTVTWQPKFRTCRSTHLLELSLLAVFIGGDKSSREQTSRERKFQGAKVPGVASHVTTPRAIHTYKHTYDSLNQRLYRPSTAYNLCAQPTSLGSNESTLSRAAPKAREKRR